MHLIKKILIVCAVLVLTACSSVPTNKYIASRDKAYLSATSIPPLKIPPGLASSSIHAEYPVSDRQYPDSSKTVGLVPPGLN